MKQHLEVNPINKCQSVTDAACETHEFGILQTVNHGGTNYQIICLSVKIFSTSSNDLAHFIGTAGLAQAEREKGIDRADDTRPLTDGFVRRPVVANLPPAFVAISPEQS